MNAPPIQTDKDLHDHAHEHAEDDLSIQLEGGLAHLEYHRAHPGYSHEHPHIRRPGGHAWDHHR
jgi:hypothetical protein